MVVFCMKTYANNKVASISDPFQFVYSQVTHAYWKKKEKNRRNRSGFPAWCTRSVETDLNKMVFLHYRGDLAWISYWVHRHHVFLCLFFSSEIRTMHCRANFSFVSFESIWLKFGYVLFKKNKKKNKPFWFHTTWRSFSLRLKKKNWESKKEVFSPKSMVAKREKGVKAAREMKIEF